MRTAPSYNVANARDIPDEITDKLCEILDKEICYDRFGSDSTNLVRVSTEEFAAAYSPVDGTAYVLQLTLRK